MSSSSPAGFKGPENSHSTWLKKQGGRQVESWYWTREAASRAWAERFHALHGRMPTSIQAADFSAVLQYLKAVDAGGTAAPDAVLDHLRSSTLGDMYVQGGRLRADGTMLHDLHVLRVKTPASSRGPWDYYDLIATISGKEAFPPV